MVATIQALVAFILGIFYVAHVGAVTSHKDTWAVLVSTSRYFYNYRHVGNVIAIYKALRQFGIPEDQIITMHAEDYACNARNTYPGSMYLHPYAIDANEYAVDIEVDYRGEEVTVDRFLRLLLDRPAQYMPLKKRLLSNKNSNVLVYLTGHGGNKFLKFQDWEILSAEDLANAVDQMSYLQRYRQMWIIVDSCQASTLGDLIRSPNVITTGSSRINENSYGYNEMYRLGVSLVDRFTWSMSSFLEEMHRDGTNPSLFDFLSHFHADWLRARPLTRADLLGEATPRNRTEETSSFIRGNPADLRSIPMKTFLYSPIHAQLKTIRHPTLGSKWPLMDA